MLRLGFPKGLADSVDLSAFGFHDFPGPTSTIELAASQVANQLNIAFMPSLPSVWPPAPWLGVLLRGEYR